MGSERVQAENVSVANRDIVGKVVMITGAGRGIGRSMATAFAHQSAKALILVALEEEELKETERLVHTVNPQCQVYTSALNVIDTEKVASFFKEAMRWSGGCIDVLCANAGICPPLNNIVESDPDHWWLGMEVNVKGCFLFAQQALSVMQEQKSGRIIFTSSIAAGLAEARNSSYQISKLAVTRLADLIDVESRDFGIASFAVHPGRIDTQLLRSVEGGDDSEASQVNSVKMPDRPAELDDVANLQNMCIFLCSPGADFLSGCWVDATRKPEDICREKDLIAVKGLLKAEVSVGWTKEEGRKILPRQLC